MNTKNYSETPRPESEKISDATATYTATSSTKNWKPVAATHRIAGVEANDEVWQFAQQHQLIAALEQTIRITRESFQDLGSLRLTFDRDPEIPSLHGIGIHAKMDTTDLEKWERQYRSF